MNSDASNPIPPPDSAAHIPPPGSEEHVNDVLERRKRFSWKSFGGDGFLVSVAFHVLLAILAIFYIVSRYKAPEKKTDPEVFATGAGGGANGDKPKAFEQKLQTRQTNVKMPARITSKSASSITLPDTPQTSAASFASGLTSGGMSKGAGGGSGGGEGTGIGIGKGGGRNFVSLFGSRGRADRLTGYIYDFTQTNDGKANAFKSKYSRSNNIPWLKPEVTRFVDNGWKLESLARYFRGPAELGVHQILIPQSPDSAAPKAFEAEGKMEGSAWIAVYRGKVRAPETADIRFCGTADNFLGVRFNGKNVLLYDCGKEPTVRKQVHGIRQGIVEGKWIHITKGDWYDMNVLIGDAGGLFSALLYYERKGEAGKKILFHTEGLPWDDVMAQDKGDLPRDLDPASPVWQCKAATTSVR